VSATLFLADSTVNFVDCPDMLQKFFMLILESGASSDMLFQHFYFAVGLMVSNASMGTEGRVGTVNLPPRSRLVSTSGVHKDAVDISLYHHWY
jgi:hypothetical protein